jgi:hypothetical protein
MKSLIILPQDQQAMAIQKVINLLSLTVHKLGVGVILCSGN